MGLVELCDKQYLEAPINTIYRHAVSAMAALTSMQPRLETNSLREMVDSYLAVTRSQIARMELFASSQRVTLSCDEDATVQAGLREFSREMARGLLSEQLEVAAVHAMLRLSSARLDSYERLESHACPTVAALGLAGVAEETAMIDSLNHRYNQLSRAAYSRRLAE